MRFLAAVTCALALAVAGRAQQWEVGFGGGVGAFKNATASRSGREADAGFKPGAAFSAFATQNMYPRLSGELRYTFGWNDMKVSSGGTEATFSGQSHAVYYDLLLFGRDRGAKIRPFALGGGGIKVYRGTGKESAQMPPLADLAILTKTQELVGLVVFGGGVKVQVGDRTFVTLDVRDYLTPAPKEVIAPAPGAKVSGWIHGFTPMLNLSFGF